MSSCQLVILSNALLNNFQNFSLGRRVSVAIGCAFVNATAEAAPDSVEFKAASTFRAWVHDLFLDLATDTDAADPKHLADTLVLLYDGAVSTAQMDHAPTPAITARQTAELVLDHASATPMH